MASVGSSQYLSHIFENTRQIVNKPEWTPGDLNDYRCILNRGMVYKGHKRKY